MFKKRLLGAACMTAAFGFGATAALADDAVYLPTPGDTRLDDGYAQKLEDGFFEVIIQAVTDEEGDVTYVIKPVDATTVVEVGDYFAGISLVQETYTEPPTGGATGEKVTMTGEGDETFTQIFLIETLTSDQSILPDPGGPDGSYDTQTFGAAGTDVWNAIFGTGGILDLGDALDIDDLKGDGSNVEVQEGTMAMLFKGVEYLDVVSDDPNSLTTSVQSSVNGGTLQYEFGLTGTDEEGATVAADGEFWKTEGIDSAYPITTASPPKPTVALALNVTQQWAGPDLEVHDLNIVGTPGNPFTQKTQLQGIGVVENPASNSPWGVAGDLDVWIRPVPEPAPLALIALGLLGLGMTQRKKKTA